MRLNIYLNEITKGSGKRVLSIFQKQIPKVKNDFISKKWNISDLDAIKILNTYFSKNHIKFKLFRKISKGIYDFVKSGESFDDGSIEIFLNKGFSSYWISNFSKDPNSFDDFDKNLVFKQLFYILSHEMIHKTQFNKSNDSLDDKKDKSKKDKSNDDLDYFSSTHEVEAYAYQAYLQYMSNKGKSDVFNFYITHFKKNDPVLKRFFKKFYQYLDKQDKKSGGK